jgi:Domain of unknown function (DUF4126)
MDYLLPAILGVSLAAATGFRIFVPLLVMGLAARGGYLPLGENFEWVASAPALSMLAIAALAEIAAYYIPVIDNLLDSIATPAAVIAGISVSAAVMTDLPPMLKWTLAIIAGGGAAGLTQTVTTLVRGASTAATAGLGNPVIATGELIGALMISVLSAVAPWVAFALAVVLCITAYRLVRRIASRPQAPR